MKTLFTFLLFSCLSVNAFAQADSSSAAYKPVGQKNADGTDKIFSSVDQLPEFMGGQEGLVNYLSGNIRYPDDAREKNKEGRVVVQFVVCTDGSLCNEKIIRSVDSSMDKEVLRVVKAMPNWKPGKQNGQAVKTYYTLPVSFKLEGQERDTSLPDAREYLTKKEEPVPVEEEEKIFTSVEHTAEFPGGMGALIKYLESNLHYPEDAKKNKIKGQVILQFMIDKDGSIKNIVVARSVGGGCTEEAIRVVSAMPKWKPGMQNGSFVKMYYTLPIKFGLNN